MPFRFAFLTIALVLVTHVIAITTGLYFSVFEFDSLMHFSGGFAIGMLGLAIHHHMTDKHHLAGHPWWYHTLFVVGFTLLIAVAWEFHEYILDNTVGARFDWPKSQVSIGDTMLDLFLGGIGGFVALCLFRKKL
ncbi:hypothetical protein HYW18_00270 [Candidatus Uhrbacteria bacterium]|nr:hypothetical protein [Candidatus Uhrbacteria bacterium]